MATAASATVFVSRLPSTTATANVTRCSALPYLPPRLSTSSFSPSLKHSSDGRHSMCGFMDSFLLLRTKESRKHFLLQTRASSDDASSPVDANELFTDLKQKWEAVENKTTVILYGGGAIVAVWLSSILVGAINSVPLLPKIMELVGLGYTGWFVYRYLLFKSSRKELATDIEALKKKIAGTE